MSRQQTQLSLERARVRDLLRYYKPNTKRLEPPQLNGSLSEIRDDARDKTSTGCAVADVHDDPPDDSKLLAHDPTLTAFTQLAAFRLDCERSFISLMDDKNQFILAEATRSVSLNSKEKSDKGDEVYLGARVLDMKWGVCPNTIQVFTAKDDSLNIATSDVVANKQCYVMNDMSALERYKDRPYIIGWPYMKFYAEVPIHSPTGHVIGTFCVVDNKPRNGLDQKGLDALNEIAFAIMKHLDLVQKQHALQRAEGMVNSLGRLGESRGALKDWTGGARNDLQDLPGRPPLPRTGTAQTMSTASVRRASTQENTTLLAQTTLPTEHDLSEEPDKLSGLVSVAHIDHDTKSSSSGNARPSQRERKMSNFDGHLTQESISSTGVKELFAHACDLIREGLDVDGVIIVDTSVQEVSDPVKSDSIFTAPESLTDRDIANAPVNEETDSAERAGGTDGPLLDESVPHVARPPNPTVDFAATAEVPNHHSTSELLGFSVRNPSSFKAVLSSLPQIDLPQSTVQGLMKKYQKGHIFEFDEDGLVIQNLADHAKEATSESATHTSADSGLENNEEKLWVSQLLNIFPGAKSIIFHALWDPQRDQWFAGCFAWTTDPARSLESVDVKYLASFGKCIMSEKSRLDALTADRAKASFISSVSHELRTPLHGVLASAESLQETSTGSVQDEMIQTVRICGEILVDTMDQILDYTKLSNPKASLAKAGNLAPTPETSTPIDLGNLVETVAAGVFAGHNYRRSTLGSLDDNKRASVSSESAQYTSPNGPIVILSIDKQISRIDSSQVSSWKRILTNLAGNALKYTSSGFINVSLLMNKAASSANQDSVILLVEDTGKGISKDFLKYELYTAFVQEDPHAAGTGLGLSIVRKLVTDLKGKIDVQSEVGYGTTVNVSLPAEISATSSDVSTPESDDLIASIRARCSGRKLCVLGFEYYPDIVETPNGILDVRARSMLALKSSLVNMAADWFGLEITTASSLASVDGDMLLVLRSRWNLLEGQLLRCPLVVFEDITVGKQSGSNDGIFPLTQPVGPHKLAKALSLCLDYEAPATELPAEKEVQIPTPSVKGVSTSLPRDQYDDAPAVLPDTEVEEVEFVPSPNVLGEAQGNGQLSASKMTLNLRDAQPVPPQATARSKVLLVEDNIINMKILINYMKIAKQDFVTAENGLEALQKFQHEPKSFKVIFMDLAMPVMDGLTSSRQIRAYEIETSLPRTRIVALTCFSSPDYQRDAALSGVDIFLIKPVPMKTLKPILALNPDDFDGEG